MASAEDYNGESGAVPPAGSRAEPLLSGQGTEVERKCVIHKSVFAGVLIQCSYLNLH